MEEVVVNNIIRAPNEVVEAMIEGMVLADPDSLERVDVTTVVKRKDAPIQDKVGIVSGGGSGHEPAHAGYIGKGMLDAAVLGEVFTSPSVDQVVEGSKAVRRSGER